MEELNTITKAQEPESQLEENTVAAVETENQKETIRDDYESMSRDEIVGYFKRVMDTHEVLEVKRHLQELYDKYQRDTSALNEEKRKAFVDEGGELLDFKGVEDYAHTTMTTLYEVFRQKVNTALTTQEKERYKNAQEKKVILDEIKELLKTGDITASNNSIRELLDKWETIGNAGREERELNVAFKVCKDNFFQRVREGREIREYALKHNYDEKIKLCEQAEALIDASSASNAFYVLQQLHSQWKNIGPVPRTESDALWERFRAATSKVNDRFHKHIDKNRSKEVENYERKTALCVEVERLNEMTFKTAKDCDKITNEVLEIQQKWRTIGFAPKEHNEAIYARFRAACDAVFERKRKFYKEYNNMLSANMALKVSLCERAEALVDSTDWKVTTDTLIGLQKRWKEIGPVSHKHSDEVWNRFRAACDKFFENKKQHFSGIDEQFDVNLQKKLALIEELKTCELPEDCDEKFKVLQDYQHRWNEIGFVPMKNKSEVNQAFSQLINKHFDKLASDDMQRNMQRFKSRVKLLAQDEAGQEKLNHERNKYITKLRQIEADVVTLENNIGFFAKSKKSDRLIGEVNEKIKVAKQNMSIINEKLDILDSVIKD
jgi:hypothetical protein